MTANDPSGDRTTPTPFYVLDAIARAAAARWPNEVITIQRAIASGDYATAGNHLGALLPIDRGPLGDFWTAAENGDVAVARTALCDLEALVRVLASLGVKPRAVN